MISNEFKSNIKKMSSHQMLNLYVQRDAGFLSNGIKEELKAFIKEYQDFNSIVKLHDRTPMEVISFWKDLCINSGGLKILDTIYISSIFELDLKQFHGTFKFLYYD